MSKRMAATLFAALTFAACNPANPGTTTQPTTVPAATGPAGTAAPASMAGEADPNTVAGFCQLMTDTIVANWPPKDSQAATVISPFLRNWAQIAAFAAISADLLAAADWTASMSIMNPVPTPPADVAAAWDKIVAFQASNC